MYCTSNFTCTFFYTRFPHSCYLHSVSNIRSIHKMYCTQRANCTPIIILTQFFHYSRIQPFNHEHYFVTKVLSHNCHLLKHVCMSRFQTTLRFGIQNVLIIVNNFVDKVQLLESRRCIILFALLPSHRQV